ncbi:MAG: magnesium transporter CorA family protein [archaeon]|nr:magnesium transporter CorA family protein [archaeon]
MEGNMFRYYVFNDGVATETNEFSKNCLMSIVDPSEEEIKELSERFGIDRRMLTAATDIEEPSMWEHDGGMTYLIIDIPFKDERGNYDTVPLMLITCEDAIIALSEKSTGIIGRFMKKSVRNIDPEDKIGFEIKFIHNVTKEYQQYLKEIDQKRRDVEKKIRTKTGEEEVTLLHDIENSLVYFITSLKGCNAILELIRRDHTIDLNKEQKNLFQITRIENKQAIEMATVYKEIISSTRDLLSTEINFRLERTMQTLAVFTIILTVPMVVTGAYGMNVDLPMQNNPYAFGLIFLGTAMITGLLCLFFKKKRIL